MQRITDINELFSEVDEIILALSEIYLKAKNDHALIQIPRAKVKSALEHLRSILDYCALDIYIYVYKLEPKKLYFPYAIDEENFNKHVDRDFKAIRHKSPRIYDLMASVQPHASGSNWLVNLCKYTNTNKHNSLSSQVKKTEDSITIGNLIRMSGNSRVTFTNSTINGVQIGRSSSIPVVISDSMTNEEIANQLNPSNPFIPITRKAEKVMFFIEGSSNDALAFIQDAKKRIATLVCLLCKEID